MEELEAIQVCGYLAHRNEIWFLARIKCCGLRLIRNNPCTSTTSGAALCAARSEIPTLVSLINSFAHVVTPKGLGIVMQLGGDTSTDVPHHKGTVCPAEALLAIMYWTRMRPIEALNSVVF
jgi:hypothetical protein